MTRGLAPVAATLGRVASPVTISPPGKRALKVWAPAASGLKVTWIAKSKRASPVRSKAKR